MTLWSHITHEDEIWAEAAGFSDYDVSTHGRVRRNSPACGTYVGKILAQSTDRYGYKCVGLRLGRKGNTVTVHGLVAKTFLGPRPEGFEAAHGDGDKSNNSLTNLRWATSVENKADSRRHGVIAKGERNGGGGKLTEDQARDVKYSGSKVPELCEKYGISRGMVYFIRRGVNWAHV